MLEEFQLTSDALARLAFAVRGADINRQDLHPASAGLLALSVGLSRQYRDDHARLDAGMALYNPLPRWVRNGQSMGHDRRADRVWRDSPPQLWSSCAASRASG